MAVALIAGPEAVLSHSTAARVHRFAHLLAEGEPEVSIGYPRNLRLSGASIHRVSSLDALDIQTHRAILVTRPARTIVDLAGRVPDPLLAKLFDEALVNRTVTAAHVAEALARTAPRPGLKFLRHLVDQRVGWSPADSRLELRVMDVLRPLSPFEVHYQVILDGRVLILDMAWPEFRSAIECDGWGVHSRSRSRFDGDRRRDNLLAAHGWTVGHVTSAMSDQEILQVALGLLLRRAATDGRR